MAAPNSRSRNGGADRAHLRRGSALHVSDVESLCAGLCDRSREKARRCRASAGLWADQYFGCPELYRRENAPDLLFHAHANAVQVGAERVPTVVSNRTMFYRLALLIECTGEFCGLGWNARGGKRRERQGNDRLAHGTLHWATGAWREGACTHWMHRIKSAACRPRESGDPVTGRGLAARKIDIYPTKPTCQKCSHIAVPALDGLADHRCRDLI
jgi:hypothetical protein